MLFAYFTWLVELEADANCVLGALSCGFTSDLVRAPVLLFALPAAGQIAAEAIEPVNAITSDRINAFINISL